MSATALNPEPVIENINQDALTLTAQAKRIVISDSVDHALACETLRGVVAMRKQISDTFGPMKEAAHKAHKAVIEQEKRVDGPLAEAERYLKVGIGSYQAAEEKKRREEETKLQAEAQRIADQEAKRAAEELALQDAIEAEKNGDKKGAEAILANPLPVIPKFVAPVVLQKTVVKQEGISSRRNWKFRVVNESLIPREYLKVDDIKLGQIVRALKETTRIPGIEVYPEENVAVRL